MKNIYEVIDNLAFFDMLLKIKHVQVFIILFFGLISYSNTFNSPFVFDDVLNIVDNPLVKNFSYFTAADKAEAFISDKYFQSRIVGFYTFALNYKIHGLDVPGYHIFNIAVHLINALLVYLLVAITFKAPMLRDSQLEPHAGLIAFFASLIFVSHPVQTQAVTYIVQRFTSLATLFYLASLVLYIKSRLSESKNKSIMFYAVSILSAILAMKTKEIAFTLPLIIILYEIMFFKGSLKKRFVILVPVILTLFVIPLSLLDFDKPFGDLLMESGDMTSLQTTMSRWDYLLTSFRVIVTYIRLLFIPVNQNLDYDYQVFDSLSNPHVIASLIFLASIFCFGIYMFNRNRLVSFGIFWFFITLSVESSIIPIADVINEHRVYLPSVGMLIAFTLGVATLLFKSKTPLTVIASVLISVSLVFSVMTYSRNIVWKSGLTLWEDVAVKSPEKARVYNNIAAEYYKIGAYDKAIQLYVRAFSSKQPDVEVLHNNIGNIYNIKGLTDKAVEHYIRAININPDYADAHYNLGITYVAQGLTDKAIEHYNYTIKLNPNFPSVYNNLGIIYLKRGYIEAAIKHFETALQLRPDSVEARNNLRLAEMTKQGS